MKSRLIFNRTFEISMNERVDIYLREVETGTHYPEGVKYAVNYRRKENTKWIVLIRVDNKEQRGHHLHFGGKIEKFDFISIDETVKFILKKRGELNENRTKGS
jgi:hypothetical protein